MLFYCEIDNTHTENKGDSKKEEAQLKRLFANMAKHIYKKHGIIYQVQAEKLNLTPGQYQLKRTDKRYLVEQGDIAALREAYREELADFGEPTDTEKEIARLRAIIQDKDKALQALAGLVANPDKARAKLAELRELIKQIEEEE